MRKLILPVILAVCLLTGCKDQGLDMECEKGIEALEQKEYKQAREHFQVLIDKEYNLPEAYRGSGIAYLGEESYPEAIAAFSRSLNNLDKPNEVFRKDVMFYLAESRIKYGEVDKGIEVYSNILQIDEDSQAFFLRGNAYMMSGDYEKAEKDFNRSLKGCTDYDLYINIYNIYAEYDKSQEGQIYLDTAMEMEPVTGEDYYQRGRIYQYKKEYDKSEEALLKALEAGYEDAMPFLGHVYLLKDEVENARAMYQEYLTTGEKKARGYNGLAICDIKEERYEQALENINKGLELNDPEEMQSLLYNEIVALEYKREFDQAESKMKEYLKKYPEDPQALREEQFLSTR